MQADPLGELETLLATGIEPSDELVEQLTSLGGELLDRFRELWERLDPERRGNLLDCLGEAAEENLVLDFLPIYALALDDADPVVRLMGLQLAAEEAKAELLERYLRLAIADSDREVQLTALEGLGAYTLAAQVEDWPEPLQRQLETALVGAVHLPNANLAARRAALLSLAYLTSPQTEREIRQAYLQPDLHEAAIEAMGRNCEDIWITDLAAEMESDDSDLRLVAVRAAAEMEDSSLTPNLVARLEDRDEDVRLAAIEALGVVGGNEAKAALTELLTSKDAAARDAARGALEQMLVDDDPLRHLDSRG